MSLLSSRINVYGRLVCRNSIAYQSRRRWKVSTSCYNALTHGSNRVEVPLTQHFYGRVAVRAREAHRTFSTKAGEKKRSDPLDDGSGDSTELATLTPGEKVVVGSRLALWAGIAVFASACAFYIGRELLPSKMSPNTIFDKAFTVVKANPEVTRRFGEPLKAYGRDHGGHREGRRNFIEHSEYVDKDDGSKRTRVRFNIEGQYGTAFVFAEVSSDMESGEFVYLIVQDKRNGRVISIIDNRAAMSAKRLAGGTREGMEVFGNLLGKSQK